MKKIKYLFILLALTFLTGINKINAFSISGNTTVTVGSTVGIVVDASDLIGKVEVSSSNQNVLAGGVTDWFENQPRTIYFTARSVGSATITARSIDASDNNGNEYNTSRSITINVVAKNIPPSVNVNPNYSSNNYLKNLEVTGLELNPKFDKNTLEYNLNLDSDIEKITITGTAEDSSANIKGLGEFEVSEGVNTFDITVVAENGNERVYKITVTVEDKNPINVKVGKNDYTVVKKKDVLGTKEGYEETTVKINNIDIPALYNKVTDVTLIALKDKEGKIILFSYNTKTGEYSEYTEFTFDLMNLYIHENKNSKYEKVTIKVQDKEIIAYKLDGIDDYYLLYATNTMTGYEGYYLYDTKENSVQRYDTTLLDKLTQEKDKYLALVLVLSSICFLTMLFLLILVNRNNKSV